MAVPPKLRRWLLDGADASVRFRVLTDVLGRDSDDPAVREARREIGRKGWAAQILREQHPSGQWATHGTTRRDLYRPKYIAQNWRLIVLGDLGVPGTHPRIRKALRLFLQRFDRAPSDLGGPGSEVCFTGNAVRFLYQFGRGDAPAVAKSVDWLVRAQKRDGGWHCFRSRTGTLDCWEALAAFAEIPEAERSAPVRRAIARGAEFYLDRGLLREGAASYAPWLRFHYPRHYYYDLLVGLDVLTSLGYGRDRRMREPLDRLERRRNADGSWNLDALHPDTDDPDYQPRGPMYAFALEMPMRPSRWITTTALTVLRRAGRL
jgi:hypothetical protein